MSWFAGQTCHRDGPNRGLLDWGLDHCSAYIFEISWTDATDAVECNSRNLELNPLGHRQPVDDMDTLIDALNDNCELLGIGAVRDLRGVSVKWPPCMRASSDIRSFRNNESTPALYGCRLSSTGLLLLRRIRFTAVVGRKLTDLFASRPQVIISATLPPLLLPQLIKHRYVYSTSR